MQLRTMRELATDDDAVSPVIGVILMVAITVILAAVIGAFVIGIGGASNETPQAAMEFDYNTTGTTVTVLHQGGDRLPADEIDIKESDTTNALSLNTATDNYTAGDTVASGTYDPGESITVVWTGTDPGRTTVLAESTAPTA